MTGSVFDEKRAPPDEAALTHALGETKPLWDALIGHVAARCDGLEPEWKYYGKKHGWQVKFTHERRALLYLVPHEGSFLAGMALRPAAVQSARRRRPAGRGRRRHPGGEGLSGGAARPHRGDGSGAAPASSRA
jgi:hypothetical protein